MNHGRVVAATLGLFAALVAFVGWRVVPGIEAELESSVARALAGRGIEVASVTADGRTINVIGGPERPEDRLTLAAVVRGVPGVRRVRSPLVVPRGAPWDADPVRLAQADREVTVPTVSEGAPRPRSDVDSSPGTNPSGSAGSGGGPIPAAATDGAASGEDGTDEPGAADARPDDSPAPGSGPGPAPDPDPDEDGDDDIEDSPEPEEGARPAGCEARLTVLAEGRTLVFQRGTATLAQPDRRVLEEIAGVLRGCGEWTLTIVGYVGEDEQGGADAWALADRRAYAVQRFLTGRGIDVSRLATVAGSPAFDEIGEPRAELYVTGGL